MRRSPDPVTTEHPAAARTLQVASWFVLYSFFILVGLLGGAHQGLDLEWTGDVDVLYRLGFLATISAWFMAYAHRHHLGLPMDIGMFLWGLSFVLVPYYIFRAEGRRGWRTLAAVLFAVVVSVALQWGFGALLRGQVGR